MGMTSVTLLSGVVLMATFDRPTEMVNEQSVEGLPTVGLYLGHPVLGAHGVLIESADHVTGKPDPAGASARRGAPVERRILGAHLFDSSFEGGGEGVQRRLPPWGPLCRLFGAK